MQETPVQFLDQEDPLEKGWATLSSLLGALLIAQLVKNLPAMQEALVQFLGWKDPLEKGMATHASSFMMLNLEAMAPHSSTLVWKIPLMEEPGGQIGRASCRERV